MNRILEVTDEDDTLILEFVDLDDLKNDGILPIILCRSSAGENPQ
jgi:hypothetical protein